MALEEQAYYLVLKALAATNKLGWDTEELLTQLRTELNVSDGVHLQLSTQVEQSPDVLALRSGGAMPAPAPRRAIPSLPAASPFATAPGPGLSTPGLGAAGALTGPLKSKGRQKSLKGGDSGLLTPGSGLHAFGSGAAAPLTAPSRLEGAMSAGGKSRKKRLGLDESLVGQRVQRYFPEETHQQWFEAEVRSYNPLNGTHELYYPESNEIEEFDFRNAVQSDFKLPPGFLSAVGSTAMPPPSAPGSGAAARAKKSRLAQQQPSLARFNGQVPLPDALVAPAVLDAAAPADLVAAQAALAARESVLLQELLALGPPDEDLDEDILLQVELQRLVIREAEIKQQLEALEQEEQALVAA